MARTSKPINQRPVTPASPPAAITLVGSGNGLPTSSSMVRVAAPAPVQYCIVHSGVGVWQCGQFVDAGQLGDVRRLLDLGAIVSAEEG